MDKYYYLEGKDVCGPLSADELAEKNLKMDSLLCKSGSDNWLKVSDYPELENLRKAFPPAPPKEIQNKKETANLIKKSALQILSVKSISIFFGLIVFGVVAGIIYFYNENGGNILSERNRDQEYINNHKGDTEGYNDYKGEWVYKDESARNAYVAYYSSLNYRNKELKDVREKAQYFGLYTFLSLFLGTIVFQLLKNSVNWVKKNAD